MAVVLDINGLDLILPGEAFELLVVDGAHEGSSRNRCGLGDRSADHASDAYS